MHLRPMTEADAPVLIELWNSAAIFDPIGAPLFAEKVFADADVDQRLRLVGEVDGDTAGFAVGARRKKEQSLAGYVKMFAVSPRHQRRGLGTHMLRALEDALWDLGVSSIRPGESAPNYLTPGVDVRYTKATVFLEDRGYGKVGQAYNMEVDLTTDAFNTTSEESTVAREGFDVRRAGVSDRENVMSMLAEIWPAWQDEVGVAFSNSPISLFIATKDNRVVAFSAYDTNNHGTGWFGPMGTAPQARGHGLGSILLKRCLQDLSDAGFKSAIIPWVAPISFYLHHVGAEVRRIFFRYEKKRHNDDS